MNIDYYARIKKYAVIYLDNFHWGHRGKHCHIIKPMRIVGKSRIYLEDYVSILNQARLEAIDEWAGRKYKGTIKIGWGTSIEQCCHIISASNLIIGRECVISGFVYIGNCDHSYNPAEPIMNDKLFVKDTRIGNHCFIGIGAKILPGTQIGDCCIIGAGAVLSGKFDSYSMVAGNPAKVIKRWDSNTLEWVRVSE